MATTNWGLSVAVEYQRTLSAVVAEKKAHRHCNNHYYVLSRNIKKIFPAVRRILFIVWILCYFGQVHSSDARSAEGLIEIYENWGAYTLNAPPPEMQPIVLQVPDAFRYSSIKLATRNFGVNILTYYPNFTSPKAPENSAYSLERCTGDCNGRVLIAINNSAHAIHHPELGDGFDAQNMGDYLMHVSHRYPVPNGSAVTEFGPQYGFDGGIEVRMPPGNGNTNRYMARLSGDRIHYDLFADCTINKFARTCTLHFSLKCNPSVYIQVVAIDMVHINEFMNVVDKADRFVTSMMRYPVCK